jgi:hypothetical protein
MNKSGNVRGTGHVASIGVRRNAYNVAQNLWDDRHLTRSKLMWVDNIKMDVKWIGGEGVDWKDEVKVLFF